MSTPTYFPIATLTLSSNDSDITFSNIPQNYRDLILVSNQLSNQINEGYIKFNNDTTAWAGFRMGASSGGVFSNASNNNYPIPTATGPSNHIMQIFDYSATDRNKNVLMHSARASEGIVAKYILRWANNSPVTSISLYPTSPYVFIAGAKFSLYGIAG